MVYVVEESGQKNYYLLGSDGTLITLASASA